jgi:hypothetical protein
MIVNWQHCSSEYFLACSFPHSRNSVMLVCHMDVDLEPFMVISRQVMELSTTLHAFSDLWRVHMWGFYTPSLISSLVKLNQVAKLVPHGYVCLDLS